MSDYRNSIDPIEDLLVFGSSSMGTLPRLENRLGNDSNSSQQEDSMSQDISRYVFYGSVALITAITAGAVILHTYKPFFDGLYNSLIGR